MGFHHRTGVKTAILLLMAAFALSACQQHESGANAAQPSTQTIAPAEAMPAQTTGSDALTQTVEIGDGRSDAEGGGAAAPPKKATATKPVPGRKKAHK